MEKSLTNDNGNITLLGLSLLLILSSFGVILLNKRMSRISEMKEKQQLLLCTKEINGKTQSTVNFFLKTNQVLYTLKITKLASIFIPQFGIITREAMGKVAKIIKTAQSARLLSYMKFLIHTRVKKCQFNLKTFKTPIKFTGVSISRDKFERAIFRRKKWIIKTSSKREKILNQFIIGKHLRSTLHKKVIPL